MKRTAGILLGLIVMTTMLCAGLLSAQDQPADNMQLLKEKMSADKKLLVASNMGLTESEAKGFWPIYDTYQTELDKINERTKRLIADYAGNYETMTDEAAQKLLDEGLAIDRDRQKLRESFMPKFREILTAKKVARYYQLENKINSVINYDLAGRIPLVK
ncbi:MAG TPA: hypothetical protein PKM59_13360 [Thermodesulfobacteriota bacterium]|nr:hypothetical protein [Deltaproteobacteria bacterium]HNR14290.1 hypothetical protein [Thermodesulfobacteriota bacterium]HNU73144.1 hypothetical protein [Thermodesulfobacteriota bacterium]